MARLFDDGSNEYLELAGAPPVTGFPMAMGCWFYSDDLVANQTLMSLGESASDVFYIRLLLAGAVAGNPIRAQVEADPNANADTSAGYSANTWHHASGIFAGVGDVRAFIDGGSKGTDVGGAGWSGTWDRTAIGRLVRSSPVQYMSGHIAETAIWDLSNWPGATGADKANEFERVAVPALAAGYSPLFFPLGLKAYWPLGGIYSANDADVDVVGGYDMTAFNTPSVADHPGGLIYPSCSLISFLPGGAPPGLSIPVAMHHYTKNIQAA